MSKEKIRGSRCPDCGESRVHPQGFYGYEDEAWEERPHTDTRECIRHLRAEVKSVVRRLDNHRA